MDVLLQSRIISDLIERPGFSDQEFILIKSHRLHWRNFGNDNRRNQEHQ